MTRKPNYYSVILMPITNFAYNFLGIYVIILFLFTFFFDLNEPGSIVSLTPNIITMANIKWMFISMVIVGIDTYLHSKKKKKYLMLSFIPSALMIIGLGMALYGFEYSVGEMMVIGFMFIVLLVMFYFDFIIFIHYPKETDEKTYATFIREGESKYLSGHYELALQAFNKAISLSSRKTEAWLGKGKTLLKIRKIPDAVACFDKVIEIDEENTEAWYRKGLCYSSEGKYPAAVHFYNKATILDEDFLDAWLELGSTYFILDQFTEAKYCFDHVIQVDPNNAKAWNFRGRTLFHTAIGEYATTESRMPRASLDPTVNPISSISTRSPAKPKIEPMSSMKLKELLPPIEDEPMAFSEEDYAFPAPDIDHGSDEYSDLLATEIEEDISDSQLDADVEIDFQSEEALMNVDEGDSEHGEYPEKEIPENEFAYDEGIEQSRQIDDPDYDSEDVFFCPKCSHIISKDAQQCPKCGVPFSDSVEDELDEMIRADLEDVFVEDDNILTEEDLSSMEENLQRLTESEKKENEKRKAVKECVVCGAMLFEGYKICPVCGEETGVK